MKMKCICFCTHLHENAKNESAKKNENAKGRKKSRRRKKAQKDEDAYFPEQRTKTQKKKLKRRRNF